MSVWDKIKILITGDTEFAANTVGTLYAVAPNNATADQTVVRSLDTATRVNSSGSIEVVPANKGRIDYSLGTDHCPNLLVEKTAAQLVLAPSDINAVSWTKTDVTTTSNAATAPDGTLTADLAYPTTSGIFRQFYTNPTTVTGTFYTNVYRVKASGKNWVCVFGSKASVNSRAWVNLATGEFGTVQIDIVNYWISELDAFGYYTIAVTEQASSTSSYTAIGLVDGDNTTTVTANGTDGVLVWGMNMFEGRVPLSYIATNATRNADVISKTGLSAVIPQVKGAVFCDGYLQAGSLSDALSRMVLNLHTDGSNRLSLYRYNNFFYIDLVNGGAVQWNPNVTIINPIKGKRIKTLITYELNNCSFYVNALKEAVDTGCTLPAMPIINIGSNQSNTSQWDGLIKAVAVAEELNATDIDQLCQYNSLEEMASEMLYTYEV